MAAGTAWRTCLVHDGNVLQVLPAVGQGGHGELGIRRRRCVRRPPRQVLPQLREEVKHAQLLQRLLRPAQQQRGGGRVMPRTVMASRLSGGGGHLGLPKVWHRVATRQGRGRHRSRRTHLGGGGCVELPARGLNVLQEGGFRSQPLLPLGLRTQSQPSGRARTASTTNTRASDIKQGVAASGSKRGQTCAVRSRRASALAHRDSRSPKLGALSSGWSKHGRAAAKHGSGQSD